MSMKGLALLMLVAAAAAVSADDRKWLFDGSINDRAIREDFARKLGQLKDAGKTVSSTDLKSQLSRTGAVVRIEEPSRRARDWSEVYRQAAPAVALVGRLYKCGKCDKWHSSIATGFFISSDGVFITNYHVMDNAEPGPMGIMTADGRLLPVREILAASKDRDVAVVRAEGRDLPVLPLRPDAPVGTAVAVIGHLDTSFYTMTEGIVSRYFNSRSSDNRDAPRMAITADYAKGSSGSPVLDAAGNVVGLASSTQSVYYNVENGHKENLQTVIKQCIPARAILDLIRKR